MVQIAIPYAYSCTVWVYAYGMYRTRTVWNTRTVPNSHIYGMVVVYPWLGCRISWNIRHLCDFGSGLCTDQLHRFCNTFGLTQLAVKFVHSSLTPYKILAMAIQRTSAPLWNFHWYTMCNRCKLSLASLCTLHSPGHIVILTDLRQARSGFHRGRFYGKSYYTIYAWTWAAVRT